MNDHLTELEQYDYIDDDYFDKAIGKYSSLIGEFIMKFSYLEHEIEIAIAEFVSERCHDVGYLFITKIDRMSDKIDLFYKYYKNLEHCIEKERTQLKEIVKAITSMSEFRNKLAHAKWQSIQKDGRIRVKIKSNKSTGVIQFKNEIIKPKDIRTKIEEIDSLINKIDEYREEVNRHSSYYF